MEEEIKENVSQKLLLFLKNDFSIKILHGECGTL